MPQGRGPASRPYGSPGVYLPPPSPSASPLTLLGAICGDLPRAVNSSRVYCGVDCLRVSPDTHSCADVVMGSKDNGDRKANICAPVGLTEQHLRGALVTVILCQSMANTVCKEAVESFSIQKPITISLFYIYGSFFGDHCSAAM